MFNKNLARLCILITIACGVSMAYGFSKGTTIEFILAMPIILIVVCGLTLRFIDILKQVKQ